MSIADYEALPEEICRRIEIVDGAIVVNVAPRRPHQTIARRLATALEQACGVRFAVDMDVDLRLRDVPLLNRRPDVVVYEASLPADAVLRPGHCSLVVEVMSPGSVTADQVDKPTEYALAGIRHYWRVEQGDGELTVFRYRLDPTTRAYPSEGVSVGTMVVTDPVAVCRSPRAALTRCDGRRCGRHPADTAHTVSSGHTRAYPVAKQGVAVKE